MKMRISTTIALLLTALPQTTPLRISETSLSSSCPPTTSLEWDNADTNLTIHLDGFATSIGSYQTTTCLIGLTIVDGQRGKKLRLKDVSVEGWLRMPAGSEVEFYVAAFWEGNEVAQISAKSQVSTKEPFDAPISLTAPLPLDSPCTNQQNNMNDIDDENSNDHGDIDDPEDSVGVFKVNLRLVARSGRASFASSRDPESPAAVSEILRFEWVDC